MTSLKIGDTVTIRRGKLKGETGKVETVSGTQVVVRLTNGTLLLQNQINLKTPEGATTSASALAEAFQSVIKRFPGNEGLYELANRMEEHLPGFVEQLGWPEDEPNA